MPLLLMLIAVPLAEIALFVWIGGRIGVAAVLALVVLSALLGIAILRGRLARLPDLVRTGAEPVTLLAAGAMTGLGAALLILPGFLTDALGLALLLPPVQRAVAARLGRRCAAAGATWRTTVIEGDYVVHEARAPEAGRLPPRGH
jgi:UPF0716 protein FxsA